MTILNGENMMKTTHMLVEELNKFSKSKMKLSRLVKKGRYFSIIRGLYEADSNVPPYLLAGSCSHLLELKSLS